MFESKNTSNPFALPGGHDESALSSLESLPMSLLKNCNSHESNRNEDKILSKTEPNQRVGRWTLDEKILFLYGLRKYGKGRWKKMSTYLPDRSLVQIKSHAQKVLKRLSDGEHVYRRLEENGARLHVLLSKFNETLDPAILHNNNNSMRSASFPTSPDTTNRRKRRKMEETSLQQPAVEGCEHIIAASALCQLAAPLGSNQQSGESNDMACLAENEVSASLSVSNHFAVETSNQKYLCR